MEGFESVSDRIDYPSEVDVIYINDHMGFDPIHVIPSKKNMEDEVYSQGPRVNTSGGNEPVNEVFVGYILFIFHEP